MKLCGSEKRIDKFQKFDLLIYMVLYELFSVWYHFSYIKQEYIFFDAFDKKPSQILSLPL